MSNLSIKDVPEAWAESLRQRAARNHRSLQGELMAIIEQALASGAEALATPTDNSNIDMARKGRIVGYDRMGHPIIRQGWMTVEQLVAEIEAKRGGVAPYYPPGIPLGVDIIREERDSR